MAETILVTGARSPAALHLSRLFTHAGYRVILADSHRFPLSSFTRLKAEYVRLPPPVGNMPDYARSLQKLVDRFSPLLVVPTCEEVFFLAAARDIHKIPLPLFAPGFVQLSEVHNKYTFNRLIAEWGFHAPKTHLIKSAKDLDPYLSRLQDMVLKQVWSRFGDRVLRKPGLQQISTLDWSAGEEWIAQEYLPGEELSAYAVASNGKLLAVQVYRGAFRANLGAAVAFEPVQDNQAVHFIAAFVERAGWTGQISFDFRHDAAGRLYAIECNPRATSGLHFFDRNDGLVDAILKGVYARAHDQRMLTMPFALWTYGLADALSSHRLREWRDARRSAADLTNWSGDRKMLPAQFAALAEIILIAARKGKSLKNAATADIEWNGEPL